MTQMKYGIMRHFIRIDTICKGKKDLKTKIIHFFENFNLTSLGMYNGQPKFILSNQKEESICIQKLRSQAYLFHESMHSESSPHIFFQSSKKSGGALVFPFIK